MINEERLLRMAEEFERDSTVEFNVRGSQQAEVNEQAAKALRLTIEGNRAAVQFRRENPRG